ncbi:MAG: peptidase M14 [Deltaproteobacteria bacterium]|nr:peptidase M14 [Deltaproteobacteria bacterium]MDQ3300068.1 M14 family metallopeptidase [Myxococcota bacterium]
MPDPVASLGEVSFGFRNAYLDHDRLTAQLRAWTAAFPELCRLTSLAQTPEGRDVWLLVVGREPDRTRPAVWVNGNLHAAELAGSSVALAIAEDALRVHLDPDGFDLPPPILERLRDVLFYIVPRITPDGAECVLRSGRTLRSVPRDRRVERGQPRWVPGDLDGDGLAFAMRVPDPGGELVEAHEFPGLLVERTLDDEGPFYKLYPEGVIENFDGKHVPSPFFLGDNPVDLNRNFPYSWAPTYEQIGAGAYPASEPESRGVVEYATAHPEIFAWLDLHTFGGVLIRPLGHAPDSKMDPEDLAIFRQLEAWMLDGTGYPTVSGHEEFLYEPDKPLRGDLTEYAYHQRGAMAYVVELWDLFKRLGMERPPKFVQFYERVTRADIIKLAWWDKDENEGRSFPPWRKFDHPQLGPVELGGVDPRIGIWNPPLHELAAMCASQANVFLRVAALAPRLKIVAIDRQPLPGGVTRVEVRICNDGYLGTYGMPSAKKLEFNEPLYAKATAVGCTLVDPGAAYQTLGHLDGWGHGLHTGQNLPAYPGSRGNTNAAWATYLVRGTGTLDLELGSCRAGFIKTRVSL